MKVSSPFNSLAMVILTEWMFSQDGQMIGDGFRHQKFGIWITIGWVMAILVEIEGTITLNAIIRWN